MTTATIAIEFSDGSIKSVYVNADGYPDHTGYVLYKYYNDTYKALRLIELGNISYLGKYIDHTIGEVDSSNDDLYTSFYIRDKGCDYYDNSAKIYNSIEDMFRNYRYTDYIYLYKDRKWHIYNKTKECWDVMELKMFNNCPEVIQSLDEESYI